MNKAIKYNYDKDGYGKSKNKRYNNWLKRSYDFNSFANPFTSQLVLYFFVVFVLLIIVDYFLTIYSIAQHAEEFNPVVVFIYDNFNYPEAVFLFFKIFVVSLNGLLLFFLKKWKNKLNKKISTFYVALATVFALGVVIYDIAVIQGVDVSFMNRIAMWFFKTLGLV